MHDVGCRSETFVWSGNSEDGSKKDRHEEVNESYIVGAAVTDPKSSQWPGYSCVVLSIP